MQWNVTKVYDLLIDCKTLAVKFALIISRKLDLGQPVDGYLDMWYCLCNITFSVEEEHTQYISTLVWNFTDEEFDQLYSMYVTILTKHNRYKGIL